MRLLKFKTKMGAWWFTANVLMLLAVLGSAGAWGAAYKVCGDDRASALEVALHSQAERAASRPARVLARAARSEDLESLGFLSTDADDGIDAYDFSLQREVEDLRSMDCSVVASARSTSPLTILGLAIFGNVIFMGFRLAANAGPPDAKKGPPPTPEGIDDGL